MTVAEESPVFRKDLLLLPKIPPIAQEFTQSLREDLEKRGGLGVSSAFLRAGAVFGEFDPQKSDLDIFVVTRTDDEDTLRKIYEAYLDVGQMPNFCVFPNLLRHPPTVLTEKEAILYFKTQAAKLIYPLINDIYQPFYGNVPFNLFPTSLDWPKEFLYGSIQFFRNIEGFNPFVTQAERKLGKQILYFLRFIGMVNFSQYTIKEEDAIQLTNSLNPRWGDFYRSLKDGSAKAKDILQEVVELAETSIETVAIRQDIILTPQEITERDYLAQLAWTIEKTRWDFWLVENEKIARKILVGENKGIWGYGRKQVVHLLKNLQIDISPIETEPCLDKENYLAYFQGSYRQNLRKIFRTALKNLSV